jgi:hypothetical protein
MQGGRAHGSRPGKHPLRCCNARVWRARTHSHGERRAVRRRRLTRPVKANAGMDEIGHCSRTLSVRIPSAKRKKRTDAPHAQGGGNQVAGTHRDSATEKVGRFRYVFNHERSHEALANETPGSIYVPGTRLFPSRVTNFQYPRSFQTRRVNNSGGVRDIHVGTCAGSFFGAGILA